MKPTSSNRSSGPDKLFRGISLENLRALGEIAGKLLNKNPDEVTFGELAELKKKHPELFETLDGERMIGGQPVSDEEMADIEYRLEMGTAVRDARKDVAGRKEEMEKRDDSGL